VQRPDAASPIAMQVAANRNRTFPKKRDGVPIAAASAWVDGARRRAGGKSDQELLAAIA
jgi:hypothetical protein